jgi:hypothetical protein
MRRRFPSSTLRLGYARTSFDRSSRKVGPLPPWPPSKASVEKYLPLVLEDRELTQYVAAMDLRDIKSYEKLPADDLPRRGLAIKARFLSPDAYEDPDLRMFWDRIWFFIGMRRDPTTGLSEANSESSLGETAAIEATASEGADGSDASTDETSTTKASCGDRSQRLEITICRSDSSRKWGLRMIDCVVIETYGPALDARVPAGYRIVAVNDVATATQEEFLLQIRKAGKTAKLVLIEESQGREVETSCETPQGEVSSRDNVVTTSADGSLTETPPVEENSTEDAVAAKYWVDIPGTPDLYEYLEAYGKKYLPEYKDLIHTSDYFLKLPRPTEVGARSPVTIFAPSTVRAAGTPPGGS